MLDSIALGPQALSNYLLLAAALFAAGIFAVIARRNAIGMLIGLLFMLNSAALNLAAFSRFSTVQGQPGRLEGQVSAIFVIVLAAVQTAVVLALVLAAYQTHRTVDMDEMDELSH